MSRIEEIKKRLKSATPGPWSREDYVDVDQDGAFNLAHVTAPDPEEPDVAVQGVVLGSLREDAELIANAPADLTYLLAKLAAVEELHGVPDGNGNCLYCYNEEDDRYYKHPCPTTRALSQEPS